jgi:hypothetical protein
MIIKVKQTVQIEKEIEINFPFITYDKIENKYFFNSAENKVMILNLTTGSILNLHYSNDGLEYPEVKKEEFFKAFDLNLQNLLEILNK